MMSKDLCELWTGKWFTLLGHYAFRKTISKHYPQYTDDLGVIHEERDIVYATDIDFNNEKKTFTISFGVINEGVFCEIKKPSFDISVDTLRLICKTVKELGW